MRRSEREVERNRTDAPAPAQAAVRPGRDDDHRRSIGWRSVTICFVIGAIAVFDLASACLELLFL